MPAPDWWERLSADRLRGSSPATSVRRWRRYLPSYPSRGAQHTETYLHTHPATGSSSSGHSYPGHEEVEVPWSGPTTHIRTTCRCWARLFYRQASTGAVCLRICSPGCFSGELTRHTIALGPGETPRCRRPARSPQFLRTRPPLRI